MSNQNSKNKNVRISLIVAMSKNHVIGINNELPWHIPGDLARFKELTTNHTIIIGRKTHESIGKLLPNRRTIVVSRTLNPKEHEFDVVSSIEQALELCKDEDEVFIAGGGEIYKETLKIAEVLYLTIVDVDIDGNTYFPSIDYTKYNKTYEKHVKENMSYTFYTFERK